MRKFNIYLRVSLVILAMSISSTYAANSNFECPQTNEIIISDITTPSIWIAPAVASSKQGVVGVGLGGTNIKDLIGVTPVTFNTQEGWICIYRSKNGLTLAEIESKIKALTTDHSLLSKHYTDIKQLADKAHHYFDNKNYSSEMSLGFIGYQKA